VSLPRSLLALGLALLLAACAVGPKTGDKTPERAVEETFLAFKEAMLTENGQQVAALTTADSGDFYRDMADEALTAARGRLAELSLDQRLVTLTLRHSLSAREMKRLSGKQLLALWVERGWIWMEESWIDRRELARTYPENYRIIGSAAAAQVDDYGEWQSGAGVAFRFEEGAWRVRLMHESGPPDPVAEALRAYYRYGTRMTEEEYIFTTLEKATGRAPGPDIWNPPL